MPDPSPPPVRIGNGAGFWGDSPDAPLALARAGALDVLTLEYLAELTMAILSHQRVKDPAAGFIHDFPETLHRLQPLLEEQPGLKVVTNAGGLNPRACAVRCGAVLEGAGMGGLAIAIVRGDDIVERIPQWLSEGLALDHMETGEPLTADLARRLLAANAYLGGGGIAEGLAKGARIVITGRVADASLTVGPAVFHFGWPWNDWDRLAGASLAGHLIECGAQATGGLWHEWGRLPDVAGIGYPIAELAGDGSFVVTKPEGTGGRVSVPILTEQLLYEIDDPACYRTPDVDVDFTTVSMNQAGIDRVRVRGATGRPPSDFLKAVLVYPDGWSASGILGVVGRDAEAKAKAAGAAVLERVRRAGFALGDSLVECLGAGDIVPGMATGHAAWEVVLRLSVRDSRRAAVERFCRELAPLVTSGPPGLVGYAGGRPVPRPAFGYWPILIPRSVVTPSVEIASAEEWAGMPRATARPVEDAAPRTSGVERVSG